MPSPMADRRHDVEPASWSSPASNPPHPNSVFGKEIKYTMEPLRGINSLRDGRIKKKNLYFLSQLYRWVIILYINCGHQGTATNMQGTKTAFECVLSFHFHDSQSHRLYTTEQQYHTFYKIRCLSVVLSICKSFAIVLSFISPYSVYVVRTFMYCNRLLASG